MKNLVTGGAGFIGSWLVKELIEKGEEVVVLDNLSTGKIEKVPEEAIFIKGDIKNQEDVKKSMKGVDRVFHLAGHVSVYESIINPVQDATENIIGSINILETAKREGVENIVVISSAAVYGNTDNLPIKEEEELKPTSPYGTSKKCIEAFCDYYKELYNLSISIARPFNVYGPGQDPKSGYSGVISKFIDNAKRGEDLIIFGDGEQTRDFIFIKDTILSLIAISNHPGVYNIGSGKRTSINKIAEIIKEKTNSSSKIKHLKEREGEIKHSQADISKLKKYYTPKITIEKGLESTINGEEDIFI